MLRVLPPPPPLIPLDLSLVSHSPQRENVLRSWENRCNIQRNFWAQREVENNPRDAWEHRDDNARDAWDHPEGRFLQPHHIEQQGIAEPPQASADIDLSLVAAQHDTQTLLRKLLERVNELISENLALRNELNQRDAEYNEDY
ncbi:hypothetical protein NPIL_567761 [Nephila pilipes]|uniref:Uncharacterized protein n=1 Tax=Nephila pilipes TaxID=299642 RepID=A0A8X6NES3_NEPPI|nr:hypothetical protein NPIL_567761 [Nephila pilipes]